ncbi:hypothetical protein J2X20_000456 [Pelomonas saccharophila]|uniref:Uncharacterized protein n=1 Tax=Roseateles saccharophilus TaxID=304 RepID=A0ABU1YG56_ROSSA|nr:hypothetical protein [Roseateles saccharophilus]MDR7267827.1 hypothetical protein [Roseateles saccharophilus]
MLDRPLVRTQCNEQTSGQPNREQQSTSHVGNELAKTNGTPHSHGDEDEPLPPDDEREDQVGDLPSAPGSMQAETFRRVNQLPIADQGGVMDLQVRALARKPAITLRLNGEGEADGFPLIGQTADRTTMAALISSLAFGAMILRRITWFGRCS